MSSLNVPNHLSIIMDGNSRWAAQRGLSASQGHKHGAENARKLLKTALTYNIKHLSLYAFSTENWNRSAHEVDNIMHLMSYYLDTELDNIKKNNIQLNVVGNLSKLNPPLKERIKQAEIDTKDNNKMHLYLAISYGGRQEIIDMVKNIISNEIKSDDINENLIQSCLYSNMPNVDLLIRTGGEKRISNFLPWHLAYSELLFVDKYWPDFDERDFLASISDFNKRKRNFGKVREEI